MAKAITRRIELLESAVNLAAVPTTPPFRRHKLMGDRQGQFAVDLVHPKRLVFRHNHENPPLNDDGSLDINRVTNIMIMEVVDYH